MSEREKIVRYYKASGDGELAARLIDLAEGAIKGRRAKTSEFLDPHGYSIAETVAAHYPRVKLQAWGGFQGAERVRAAFINEEYRGEADFSLAAVQLTWDERYYRLTHRDVLGALMGLGLKREVMGDIIMQGPSCQVVVDVELKDYFLKQITTVGAATVEVKEIDLTELAAKEEKIKDIRTTVPSLRLDTVAASGFGVSRSRMAEEIAADKLKLNWQDAKSAAQAVKQGDIISMRGRGRVEVCEIVGQTKKGRISLLLKRFL
ncbi:RNA-binding protein [Azotosporobacter soli]|uniref:YlmH family RNA-binding protein n=1 Tax=Azotosporobacter soli TaxID=3055040 RepID=UPI0031FE8052